MILYTEDKECCTFPKGNYFEYCRFFRKNGKPILEGKGKLGCLIKIELSEKQATEWLKKYKTVHRIP